MYINEKSKVVVQGITGGQGSFHTKLMKEYGTNIVAGVTPKKGGQEIHGIPVFNTVAEAKEATGCDTSIVFVPARFTYGAVREAILAKIHLTCIITENVPVFDMLNLVELAKKHDVHLIGPNCPGMMVPDKFKLGIMPGNLAHYGDVTVIAKSGTLSYEITKAIGNAGIGVRTYVGIGGDPIRGTTMLDAVEYYNEDPETKIMVLIGEIGGSEEEETAVFLKSFGKKPVVAYIAGKSAPKGKRMGHAGAIISGDVGTAEGKIKALEDAGALIASTPWDVPKLLQKIRDNQ
jgi:succinyl-CoA synthetase alpha subunit